MKIGQTGRVGTLHEGLANFRYDAYLKRHGNNSSTN